MSIEIVAFCNVLIKDRNYFLQLFITFLTSIYQLASKIFVVIRAVIKNIKTQHLVNSRLSCQNLTDFNLKKSKSMLLTIKTLRSCIIFYILIVI